MTTRRSETRIASNLQDLSITNKSARRNRPTVIHNGASVARGTACPASPVLQTQSQFVPEKRRMANGTRTIPPPVTNDPTMSAPAQAYIWVCASHEKLQSVHCSQGPWAASTRPTADRAMITAAYAVFILGPSYAMWVGAWQFEPCGFRRVFIRRGSTNEIGMPARNG